MDVTGRVEWVSAWKYNADYDCGKSLCDVYYMGLDNGLKVRVFGDRYKDKKPWKGDVVHVKSTHRKYMGWVRVMLYEPGNSVEIVKYNEEARNEWKKNKEADKEEYYRIVNRIKEIDKEIEELYMSLLKKYLDHGEKPKTLDRMYQVLHDLKFGPVERGMSGKTSVQLTGYFGGWYIPPTGLCKSSLYQLPDNYRNYILRKMKEYGWIDYNGDVNNEHTMVSITPLGRELLSKITREYNEKSEMLDEEWHRLNKLKENTSYYKYLLRLKSER